MIVTSLYESPVGLMELGAYEGRICMADWVIEPRHARVLGNIRRYLGAEAVPGDCEVIGCARAQLDEYFAGTRRSFSLPLHFTGTPFSLRVWESLRDVSYGATESYSALAGRMESPQAVRAVARAVGANPISIIIPCHRIIGASGALTGYAGGLEAKAALLALERDSL